MEYIEWEGLYAKSWGDDLVPEAYSHPAKMSRGLIRQIYRYMLDEGMIAPGDVVGDPFGGVSGGALDAMLNGLHWRGVELEPRFVTLGQQNIELWNGRYSPHFRQWGTAVLIQGDSRQFAELVHGIGAVVSSPPFLFTDGGGKEMADRAVNVIRARGATRKDAYGSSPGQLGSMPSGDLDAAISSPPYANTINSGDGPGARWDAATHPNNPDKISSSAAYGKTPGQLGALDGVVTSPPFEATNQSVDVDFLQNRSEQYRNGSRMQPDLGLYGDHPGNIGNDTGDTFWTASRAIVEQVYTALKPGGYAAWVTGDFVRKGKRVYFGEQWLALCKAVGFEPVAWAVAWKVERHGIQSSLFGDVEKRVDRVSFFRQLANKRNPDAAVLNEDVIFVRKPL